MQKVAKLQYECFLKYMLCVLRPVGSASSKKKCFRSEKWSLYC